MATSESTKNKHVFDLPVRVLVYEEDGEIVAHGLEMDLLAYGASEKEAVEGLLQSIVSQISFAAFKGNPEMVYFPAEHALFDRWEMAHAARLKGLLAEDKSTKLAVKAIAISVPGEKVDEAKKSSRFDKDRDTVCA